MLPVPATRAVIYTAAPLPYPAGAGTPRHTGPRRLIASPPAAGATQSALRRPGPLKITASCGQTPCPRLSRSLLSPALSPPAGGSARARRSRILHASPELRWSSQSRARGKERSLRSASFPARLRHASASSARFVSICGIRVCCQVSFPPLQAALTASVQSIALTRPLQPAGGPSVVPSVDSSHAPPCCAGSSG